MAFPNIYMHRKVADSSARGCDICFKPSTSVLVTPENQDFFYVCPAHLKDTGFCTPIIDKAAVEAKRKKELEEEVERVKKEFEEKQKKKKEKDEKDKSKDKKTDEKKDEKGKDKDGEEKKPEDAKGSSQEDEPRVFELKKTFYQQRLDKKRNTENAKRSAEIAKRNRERLQNPTLFPSVPQGPPQGPP